MKRALCLASIVSCLCVAASAQTPSAPVRVRQNTDITVTSEGSVTTVFHGEMQILNSALVGQLSQLPLSYDAALVSDMQVTEAFTQKPGGEKIPVDPTTILTQQAPTQSQSALTPIYTDLKQKIVIFPAVEAGDTLHYTFKMVSKDPYFPGQFSRAWVFMPVLSAVDETRITLHIPKSRAVQVSVRNAEQTKTINGDMVDYIFRYSQPVPRQPLDARAVVDFNLIDHVLVSSFKDQDDMAHQYANLIAEKLTVTPKIQQQADTITAGIADKREQARALYEWVGRNVRYVAVAIGQGAIIPHPAEWTLTNRYGDCKDQAVLLTALLTAKGIKANPVLIHSTTQFTRAPLPVVAQFNHAIVYIADFKIYADTTPGTVPFGSLPDADYGRPVLHVVSSGTAQFQTPLAPAGLLGTAFVARAKIDVDTLSVSATTTATGPWAADLRRAAGSLQATGTQRAAENALKARNMPEATGNYDLPPNNGFASNLTIASNFSNPKVRPQTNLLPMITALRLVGPAGDRLLGPIASPTLKATDATACYSGRQTEDITLELPAGRRLANLPADTVIQTANLDYRSHWALNGQTLTLHREFTTTMKDAICSGKTRSEVAAALARIRDDHEKSLMLAE